MNWSVEVSDDGSRASGPRYRVSFEFESDYISLEPQTSEQDAEDLAADARGLIARMIVAAIDEEREACAQIAESHSASGEDIAALIRERGAK